jgi:hypothetical protein
VADGDQTIAQRRSKAAREPGLILSGWMGTKAKRILKTLQQIVVESQVASFLLPKRACPEGRRVSVFTLTAIPRSVYARFRVPKIRSSE